MILLKIFRYKCNLNFIITFLILILICICQEVYADTKKLTYNFDFKSNGLHVKSCLYGAEQNQRWLLPLALDLNKKEFEITIQTSKSKKILEPHCDYFRSTNDAGDDVCITHIIEYGSRNGSYDQEITKKHFVIFGNHNLPIPEFEKSTIDFFDVNFTWNNFNKIIDSSFGKFKKYASTKLKPYQFRSLYLISGFDSKVINGAKLYFVSKYKNLINGLKSTIIRVIRGTDNDFKQSKAFRDIFIFLQKEPDTIGNPGFGLNGDNTYIQVIALSDKQKIDNQLTGTLSHEHYHKILGGCLIQRNAQVQDQDSWFFEGFTDYFSFKNNLEQGIWTVDDYLKNYNKRISQYYAYSIDNRKLSDLYGQYIYGYIANYTLGMMYAHNIESTLYEKSAGKLSLLGFLKFFVSKYYENKEPYFTIDAFFHRLYDYSGIRFDDIETCIKNNKLLPKKILNGELCLSSQQMQMPHYSSDFFNLTKELKYDGYMINLMYPDNKNEYIHHIKIIDDNKNTRSITLVPNFKLSEVPKYIKCPTKHEI